MSLRRTGALEVATAAVRLHMQGPVDTDKGGCQHEYDDGRKHDGRRPGRSGRPEVPPEAVVAAQYDVQLQDDDEQHKHDGDHLQCR